jgi:hypothetical protein
MGGEDKHTRPKSVRSPAEHIMLLDGSHGRSIEAENSDLEDN